MPHFAKFIWHFEGIVYRTMQVFFDLIPFTTAGLYYLVFKWMLWRSRKEEAL